MSMLSATHGDGVHSFSHCGRAQRPVALLEVMMKVRKETPNAWSLVLAAGLVACGAGSALDDYSDGVPDIVPQPIVDGDDDGGSKDGGAGDGGSKDGGSGDGGSADGGQQGGQQGGAEGGGGAEIGDPCMGNGDCMSGGTCLTNVSILNLVELEFTGGYCSKMGCTSDAQCPEGSGCQTLTSTCLQKCARANECRTSEGYECAAPPAIPGGTGGGTTQQRYCLPEGAADIGGIGGLLGGNLAGLLGGQGGAGGTGGFLAGLGGLLGGLGGAGGN
jgi:hypothetical protein